MSTAENIDPFVFTDNAANKARAALSVARGADT